jgi:hypothetical protein
MANSMVVHVMRSNYHVYIGRRNVKCGLQESKWANPFHIGPDGDRDEVCDKYEKWFYTQPHLVNSVHELRGKILACWCAPKRCHGEFLVKLANK